MLVPDKNYMFEFFGLPGAGKSALLQNAVDKLEDQGYSCCGKGNIFIKTKKAAIWLQALLFYCKNIKVAGYYLLYTLTSSPGKPTMLFYTLSRYFELLKIIYILEIRRSEIKNTSIVLLDQGILQCIWSITSRGGNVNKDFLKKCLAISNDIYPEGVVFVKVAPELAAGRITNRNSKCVFDHLPLAECCKLFTIQESNLSKIVEAVEETLVSHILTVDGSKAFHDNVGMICNFFSETVKDDH